MRSGTRLSQFLRVFLPTLTVPGRPSNLDNTRTGAYCAFSGCGWVCLDMFSRLTFLFFLPLSGETARYRLK